MRAKGFLRFEESDGFLITYQQVGGRVEVLTSSLEPQTERGGGRAARLAEIESESSISPQSSSSPQKACTLVLIGQNLDREWLLRGLKACEAEEASPSEGDEGTGCGACDIHDSAANETDASDNSSAAALHAATTGFASRVRSDTRFDSAAIAVRECGALVAFRMHGWLGVSANELTTQLMEQINGVDSSSSTRSTPGGATGTTYCVPFYDKTAPAGEQLTLLQALAPESSAAAVWQVVYQATEVVMMGYFGAVFCGGCECIDKLAGQVLA